MTMWIDTCENWSQTRAIFTRHPKRELHEVHYARCVAALEDKIVQAAVVAILTPIYEAEFLGFSYGFRPGRGQHDALDALAYGISARKINWILDADISRFFDTLSREWLIRFVEHRIGDRRIIRLIQKWLKAGVLEDGRLIETRALRKVQWHPHCLRTCTFITSTISGSSSGARATQGAI